MKLWYKKFEMREARQEADRLCKQLNADIPLFFKGETKVRMAWKEAPISIELFETEEIRRHGKDVCSSCFIPEAELVVNDEVVARDLLELLALDIIAIEMAAIRR